MNQSVKGAAAMTSTCQWNDFQISARKLVDDAEPGHQRPCRMVPN
jgi:hypothetical protein